MGKNVAVNIFWISLHTHVCNVYLEYFDFWDNISYSPGWPWKCHEGQVWPWTSGCASCCYFLHYRHMPTYLIVCGTGDKTQGFVEANQALCQLSYIPSCLMQSFIFCDIFPMKRDQRWSIYLSIKQVNVS